MKRFTVAVVAISGCIIGPACQAIVGIEDRAEAPPLDDGGTVADNTVTPGTDSSGNTDGSGDSGCDPGADVCLDKDAAPPLGCPTGCLPPAPADWKGPSAIYDGAESGKPTDCPATYPTKEIDTAYYKMTSSPATCDCGAAQVSGRTCSASVVAYTSGDCSGLGAKQGTASSTSGLCLVTLDEAPTAGSYVTYKVATPVLTAGACSFPNAKTTKPALTFEKVEVACGLPQATQCAGRADCVATPVPDQPFTRLCIHRDGDFACPSEDYKQRFVAHKKITDTRECSACTATPVGGACGTKWGTSANQSNCAGMVPPTDKNVDQCYSYPGKGTHVNILSMGPTAPTCTPAGGVPTGEAKTEEPVTFCCNQ
jgi:hypothetical protein